MCEELRAPASH